MTGVLYLSYEGMLQPLGQSQVLAYLERLAGERPVYLISFEKPGDWRDHVKRDGLAGRVGEAGINWHPLRYHKRPSAAATSWDIARAIHLGAMLVRRHGLSIVHARSYVPSVMALAIRRLTGAQFIFDMRGFWADERIDAGLWQKDGRLYKLAKGFERRFLLAANAVVSLTDAARREIEGFDYLQGRLPPITVIPTCTDLSRFSTIGGPRPDPFTLGYVGSASGWYDFDEVLAVWTTLKQVRPDARLLIVNRSEHDVIRAKARSKGVDPGELEIVASDFPDMPHHIRRMSAGVVIATPGYSHIARAPTRLGEFLGCGVPVIGSPGVGDMSRILEGEGVGVLLEETDASARTEAVDRLLALAGQVGIAERCADAARRHFSLDDGVAAYRAIYRKLDQAA